MTEKFYCSICNCELEIDEKARDFYNLIKDLEGTSHICESCKEKMEVK